MDDYEGFWGQRGRAGFSLSVPLQARADGPHPRIHCKMHCSPLNLCENANYSDMQCSAIDINSSTIGVCIYALQYAATQICRLFLINWQKSERVDSL